MTRTLAYGSWPSDISAAAVAAGSHPVDAARFVGNEVWWSERMPADGGRTAIRTRRDGELVTLLGAPWDVRSRVNEYGGGAWTTNDTGALFFVDKSDQRIWALRPDGEPVALTPAGTRDRFGDLHVAGDDVLAVRESHGTGASVTPRAVVAVPVDGSGADDPSGVRVLVTGRGFLAYPRMSADGERIAWIAWDHPRMPWDGTRLHTGRLHRDGVSDTRAVAGGDEESVVQPEWAGTDLLFSSDRSGWWNVYRATLDASVAVAPADADTGGPLWNLGSRWFAPLPDGRIVAVRTTGSDALVVIDTRTGDVTPIDAPLSFRVGIDDVRGSRVLVHGGGATTLGGLWLIDLSHPEPTIELIRSAVDDEPDASWLSVARAIEVPGPRGTVHAFDYRPAHPAVTGPDDEAPPYLVLVHGGPTAHVSGAASLDIAYFTSRGIGVLDVNYGGSSGYGRAYRRRLAGEWGIVDRDDVVAAASAIAVDGTADGRRLAIRGGSAGGWTVLCALTATDRFAAGISRYGVGDLRALVAETHDFEAHYLDGLVGPFPAAEAVYIDRSPLSHLDRFTTPMLIEQGLDDEVVPPAQSEAVRDALAANGIPHAYLAFEGEAHGFRRTETIVRSLESELSFLGQILGFVPADVERLRLENA